MKGASRSEKFKTTHYRVRYWAVYTERGFETTFDDRYCVVTGKKDENRFISWKTSEFYNRLAKGLDIPEEWAKRPPKGVNVDGDKVKGIAHPANQYLSIDYEVVGRYQKEDLQIDDQQAQYYKSGAAAFDKFLSPDEK